MPVCSAMIGLFVWLTVVSKDLLSSSGSDRHGDGDAAGSDVSYERFLDTVNSALWSVASSSGSAMVHDSDADIFRQVAVLYRVTQLAVHLVGRGSHAAASLLGLSARCYEEQFAARVATEQGLVSVLSSSSCSLQCNIV